MNSGEREITVQSGNKKRDDGYLDAQNKVQMGSCNEFNKERPGPPRGVVNVNAA